MDGNDKKKRFIINAVYFFIIGIMVIGVCKYLLPILVPFLIAFLIAALIQIPVKKIGGRSKVKKKVSAILFCSLFYALSFILVIVLGVKLLEGIRNLLMCASVHHLFMTI